MKLNCGFPTPRLSSCHGRLFAITLLIHQGDYGLSSCGSCLRSPAPLSVTEPLPHTLSNWNPFRLSIFKAVFKIQLTHEPFLPGGLSRFLPIPPKHWTLALFSVVLITTFYTYFLPSLFLEYKLPEGQKFLSFHVTTVSSHLW